MIRCLSCDSEDLFELDGTEAVACAECGEVFQPEDLCDSEDT